MDREAVSTTGLRHKGQAIAVPKATLLPGDQENRVMVKNGLLVTPQHRGRVYAQILVQTALERLVDGKRVGLAA